MNAKIFYMIMILCFLAMSSFSEQAILQVGDKKFSQTDIKNLMKTNIADPFMVVEQLKQEEVVKTLVKIRNGDSLEPQTSLYRQIFDSDYEKDKMKVELKDIPPMAKTAEAIRLNIFKQWVDKMADDIVPVIFLDQNAFWTLMQNTNSYKIRKKSGYEPKIDNWEYTRAELIVKPAMIVATRNKETYIVGTEMNDYITGNFNGIRSFATREKSINEVRNILAKYVVAGKLTTEPVLNKSIKLDTVDMEQAADRFIQRNMKDENLALKGANFGNRPNVMEVIYNSYKEKNQSKLVKFKQILKGEINPTKDDLAFNLILMETAERSVQKHIMNAIADDELYDWMKANKFLGSQSEAREELTSIKYRADIDGKIKAQGISITVFPDDKK